MDQKARRLVRQVRQDPRAERDPNLDPMTDDDSRADKPPSPLLYRAGCPDDGRTTAFSARGINNPSWLAALLGDFRGCGPYGRARCGSSPAGILTTASRSPART